MPKKQTRLNFISSGRQILPGKIMNLKNMIFRGVAVVLFLLLAPSSAKSNGQQSPLLQTGTGSREKLLLKKRLNIIIEKGEFFPLKRRRFLKSSIRKFPHGSNYPLTKTTPLWNGQQRGTITILTGYVPLQFPFQIWMRIHQNFF